MDAMELAETIETAWMEWQEALAQVPPARLAEPGVVGQWSVRDLVAHVTWSEREMLKLFKTHDMSVASPLWRITEDERNEKIYQENRNRTTEDVAREAEDVHGDLVVTLGVADDEDLTDPKRFKGMPPNWVPWEVVRGNTYKHYREHTEDLKAWLEKG